jgi:hypothetical protein
LYCFAHCDTIAFMVASGGAATINGVLYQLLGTIHRAASLRVGMSSTPSGDVNGAMLVIEPLGGGGDLQIHFPSHTVIEQWKAKGDGTWSLNDIVEHVLPDLYLAVRLEDEGAVYRFVTEGRQGDWVESQAFFQSLDRQAPSDPLDALDDQEPRWFARDLTISARALFAKIAASVHQSRKSIREEPLDQVCRNLWHLLRRFEFEGGRSEEDLIREIDNFLLAVVTNQEDVEPKRHQLCGLLLELGKGNSSITPRELLSKVQLDGLPITEWAEVRGRIEHELGTSFRFKRYDYQHDIRSPVAWPSERAVLVVTGDSGTGKSWSLCAVAAAAMRAGDVVALVDARGTAIDTWNRAASLIWQHVLHRDGSPPLSRLLERIRQVCPQIRVPRILILVDDMHDPIESRHLIEMASREPGVNLGLALPRMVAMQIVDQYAEHVHLAEVSDFSFDELHELLNRQGHDWTQVPADVRQTLRLPILAGLYLRLADDGGWHPTREYELYERMWNRIARVGSGSVRPNARSLLGELACSILGPDAPYPWPQSSVRQAGMTDEEQLHLEASGWLASAADGTTRIWHDRLLNWAVALGLIERRIANRIGSAELCHILEETQRPGQRYAGRSLSYVAMDVLWVACNGQLKSNVPDLIATLEGWHFEYLYRHLLPTLGERAVEPLIERARRCEGRGGLPTPIYVAEALVRIGGREPDSVQRHALALIEDPSVDLQEIGMRVLARLPVGRALDRLWHLHCENEQARAAAIGNDDRAAFLFRREVTMAALSSCAETDLTWLNAKLQSQLLGGQTADLLHTLASVRHEGAKNIWLTAKGCIASGMDCWSLIRCIERFEDVDELARLRDMLSGHPLDAASAFCALARLAPDIALQDLGETADSALVPTAWRWFPQLALYDAVALRSALLRRISSAPPDSLFVAQVYRHDLGVMDEATLNYLLDRLDDLLVRPTIDRPNRTNPALVHLLSLLSAVWNPHQIPLFSARRGSLVEERLSAFAKDRASLASRTVDSELEHSRLVLLKIGGEGFSALINDEMSQSDYLTLQDGLDWCVARPNQVTRDALWTIAQRPIATGDRDQPYLRQIALQLLASFGEETRVVEFLLDVGECFLPDLINTLAAAESKIGEHSINRAIRSLSEPDEARRLAAMWVIATRDRLDLAEHLQRVLEVAPVGSRSAIVAIRALRLMRARDDVTIELLARRLQDVPHRGEAGAALLKIGTPAALDAVESCLRAAVPRGFSSIEQELAVELWHGPTKRLEAARLIWMDRTLHPQSFVSDQECIEAIGDLDDHKARSWLIEQALTPPHGGFGDGYVEAALTALARIDPEVAFRGCESLFRPERLGQSRLIELMLGIDTNRAIGLMIERLPRMKPSARDEIGRALRLATGSFPQIEEFVLVMLRRPEAMMRRAGVELLGWLPNVADDTAIRDIGLNDPDRSTRSAAQRSAAQRARERSVDHLMHALQQAATSDRWALLLGIVELGDPKLLSDRRDGLWLGNFLPNEPNFAEFAKRHLERRLREIDRAAQERDRNEPYDE